MMHLAVRFLIMKTKLINKNYPTAAREKTNVKHPYNKLIPPSYKTDI